MNYSKAFNVHEGFQFRFQRLFMRRALRISWTLEPSLIHLRPVTRWWERILWPPVVDATPDGSDRRVGLWGKLDNTVSKITVQSSDLSVTVWVYAVDVDTGGVREEWKINSEWNGAIFGHQFSTGIPYHVRTGVFYTALAENQGIPVVTVDPEGIPTTT